MFIQHILRIRTSPRQHADFVAWEREKSGIFTMRSAYTLATCDHVAGVSGGASSAAPGGRRSLWNCVWKSLVPQKMKITMWKAAIGALPTQSCKMLRHLATRSTCPVCGREEEGSYHALVACSHARMVWTSMRERWPLPDDKLLVDNGKEWILHLLSSCSDAVRDMIIMLCWRIWQRRNDLTHGMETPPVHVTVDFLDSYYRSVCLAGRYTTEEILKGKMSSSALPSKAVKTALVAAPWPKPPQGRVALSVDGSFSGTDGSAAAGMVLHDQQWSYYLLGVPRDLLLQ